VLPRVIRDFRGKYPDVQLHLHQGTSDQIAEMASLDRIDFAINTGSQDKFPDFVLLPIYSWHRQIIVPKDHPLAQIAKPTLQQLAEYPLVTYVFSFTGPSSLQQQFARAGLEPNVSLTARDADVIKTYVRLGLGVGVVASMAIEPEDEKDLAVVEAGHLFPSHITWIGFRSGALLRGFTYDFIQLLAPHLTRERIERILSAATPAAREKLISAIELPRYD
jgi:LysR family cys regulon transcriptional activator